MFEWMRSQALRLLRVPPDPAPPTGAAGSLRVFRGGANLYKFRVIRWGLAQLGAVAGIVFSLGFLDRLENEYDEVRRAPPAQAPVTPPAPAASAAPPSPAATDLAPTAPPEPAKSKSKLSPAAKKRARSGLARMVERWPAWIFPLLTLLEFAGIALFAAQVPFTYAVVRLDYDLRWYMVTDRSLRIRTGITTVQESTMSFANVQQVVVSQGPLQRLLGIADVRVQSAGGGGDAHEAAAGDSLHTGVFHGVDNAHEIRDLILERLRQFRAPGLGDPDESPAAPAAVGPEPPANDALSAARAVLAEARALRLAVG